MTSRSPPLSRIIPIFLWLKLKELWWLWLYVFCLFTIAKPWLFGAEICEGSNCEIMGWWWISFFNAIITVLVIAIIFMVKDGLVPWLRSNWQQATRIAKAREKGR